MRYTTTIKKEKSNTMKNTKNQFEGNIIIHVTIIMLLSRNAANLVVSQIPPQPLLSSVLISSGKSDLRVQDWT